MDVSEVLLKVVHKHPVLNTFFESSHPSYNVLLLFAQMVVFAFVLEFKDAEALVDQAQFACESGLKIRSRLVLIRLL